MTGTFVFAIVGEPHVHAVNIVLTCLKYFSRSFLVLGVAAGAYWGEHHSRAAVALRRTRQAVCPAEAPMKEFPSACRDAIVSPVEARSRARSHEIFRSIDGAGLTLERLLRTVWRNQSGL